MIASAGKRGSSWGWGTSPQIWACRLSQTLGLVVVLGMLWTFGAGSPGPADQARSSDRRDHGTSSAAPAGPDDLQFVGDDMRAEGMSWLPPVDDSRVLWQDELLPEQWRDAPESRSSGTPTETYPTETYKYVRYDNGDEALYDLTADPAELKNPGRNPVSDERRGAPLGQLVAR
jgi:hypothetical protein